MTNDCSEQIFDYLVDEMLNGPKPPDLSERIEKAWAKEQSHGGSSKRDLAKRMVAAELAQPAAVTNSVENAGKILDATPVSQPTAVNRRRPRTRRRSGPSVLRSMAMSLSIVAATVALAYVGWTQLIIPNRDGDRTNRAELGVEQFSQDSQLADARGSSPGADQGAGRSSASQARGDRLGSGLPSPGLASSTQAKSANSNPTSEQPPLKTENEPEIGLANSVAEQSESILENTLEPPREPDPGRALAYDAAANTEVSALTADEIVEQIDRQLLAVWQSLGVSPSRSLTALEMAEKLHRNLTGNPLEDGQLPTNFVVGGRLDTQGWIQQLLQSDSFSKHWAGQWTNHLMRGSSWPEDSQARDVISSYLAERLSESNTWHNTIRELLDGEVAESGLTKTPKNATSAFFSGLAGNSNYRLVNRIGTHFMNVQAACVRCHDRQSDGLQSDSLQASGLQPLTMQISDSDVAVNIRQLDQQRGYWNLIALFKGIRADGNGYQDGRELFDQQAAMFATGKEPLVFYDSPTGELVSVDARLPDGSEWRSLGVTTPRKAFSKWLVSTPRFDQAVVNQTWRLLLGRPLVPPELALEEVAVSQRAQLLKLLAEQFRAHDGDMKQLVAWIVRSLPFNRASVPLARSEWLAANESMLQRIQLAELVFAAGSSLGATPESRDLQRSVDVAKRWSGSTNLASGDVMLAQPDLSRTGSKNTPQPQKGTTAKDLPMPPMSFAIHGERFSATENDYIQRISENSQLSWDQKAEHVILLSEFDFLGNRNRAAASSLLEHFDGNVEASLRTLLWAVKNSSAR